MRCEYKLERFSIYIKFTEMILYYFYMILYFLKLIVIVYSDETYIFIFIIFLQL